MQSASNAEETSTQIKEDPEINIFGFELQPLSAAQKQQFDVASKMPKRKFLNLDDPRPYNIVPVDLKIKEIIKYLLVDDLRMGNDIIHWTFTDPSGDFSWLTSIQRHEIFPYFLYKAVWDEDFEAIQWGDHNQGETILVNFELLFLFARGHGQFASYRPPSYQDDFIPGQPNRLEHNLVHIYGFNGIGCCNLEEDRVLNERSHVLDDFFEKLDKICQKYNLNSKGRWHEFHHSDFYQADNPLIEDRHRPKRKNSKFFKICQTLKFDYRVRKICFEKNAEDKVPKPIRKKPERVQSNASNKAKRTQSRSTVSSLASASADRAISPERVPIG
ncbi:Oidioi.mRNA.OKI2018_I69.chr2.g8001.t1.cds [Oikopleura dioica]|uniref:Oidioi.mRNA.OKI2018_I69.chr2.g8001.t1.cds n=1 Tax=Oikopleura dioica TaxID=34765 RepID=A0ABN7TBD1_OIKDI|nr:Oidioi.mRNA.OKI2018_I69.chr2.g8001.t1.cds [Oikopleura dioica]